MIEVPKSTTEMTNGHPTFRAIVKRNGWERQLKDALLRAGYTEDQAFTLQRDGMRTRRGAAKKPAIGTGDD